MPHYINSDRLLLVGLGYMGQEYASVLQAQGVLFDAVGRGERACRVFEEKTGVRPLRGGIEQALNAGYSAPAQAIVSVSVDQLYAVTLQLLRNGVKRILVEKPAGLSLGEIESLEAAQHSYRAEVYVAYNRRFFASTCKAREMILEDGGVDSFTFDFTEWSDRIEALDMLPRVKARWFLANSTHVCDLAFYLGGIPETIDGHAAGSLPWHSAGAVFCGSGLTAAGIPFSYHANWRSGGRWGVALMTTKRRILLRPLEEVYVQNRGSVQIDPVPLDDELDKKFKPGLYRQSRAFLSSGDERLLTLTEHAQIFQHVYSQICPGYTAIEEHELAGN